MQSWGSTMRYISVGMQMAEELNNNITDRKTIGRIGLSTAINYFTIKGYTVSLPINDTQWYDLIIEKDGIFQTVQCKSTKTKNSIINLKSSGGTNGSVYDTIFNHSNLDYLFCVNKDLNMWLIPISKITNCKQITLSSKPHDNGRGFETYIYQVYYL